MNAKYAGSDRTARAGMLLLAMLLWAACEADTRTLSGTRPVSITVDHHVHVLSPGLVGDWKSLGVSFSRPDSAYTSVTAIFGTRAVRAFLVSMAHMYGTEDFRRGLALSLEAEHVRVQHANDHVAHEVGRAPTSFLGFCSVPLLRPYANAEIERCRDQLHLAGLKLHLPAAEVDLTNRAHLDVLASVASRAAVEGRPLLVHLAPVDGELRPDELRAFIDHVVEPNPELELYLAHLGGNGGYRISAERVVRAFAIYLHESDVNTRRRIFFELSGALLARRTDGVPRSGRSDARKLAEDLRALGLERIVFGSDYPVFDPADYAGLLHERLPLSAAELGQIMGNRAPAFVAGAESRSH